MFVKGAFIGGGGFGKVYYAADAAGNAYALKELNLASCGGHPAVEENVTRRFRQEAVKQAEFNHRNVIRVVHQELQANPPYFVMELAVCTFDLIVKEYHRGLRPFSDVKAGLFDILSGLDALHELGIWHRDLKPQNVLFLSDGRYALSDFGLIAVRDSGATTLTLTGTTAGTAGYAPPEFMKDFKKASASSDIYSFGAILHDIFVNRVRVPYSELKDGANKIGLVISKCTRLKQYSRYKNVEELRADLFDAIAEFELNGSHVKSNDDMAIFDLPAFGEQECDAIIDLIEATAPENLYAVYRKFSAAFVENVYAASPEAADHIAEQYARYVLEGTFDFNYCDVLADRLLNFYTKGNVATKAICLLALLKMGTSHNRWYVENRFVKHADPSCTVQVVRRFNMDAKTYGVDLSDCLAHLFRSISVRREQLHPDIAALVP